LEARHEKVVRDGKKSILMKFTLDEGHEKEKSK
jgi:hypothetical protein